jgi:hypothetical protein
VSTRTSRGGAEAGLPSPATAVVAVWRWWALGWRGVGWGSGAGAAALGRGSGLRFFCSAGSTVDFMSCRSGDQLGTSSDPFHGTQPDVKQRVFGWGLLAGVRISRVLISARGSGPGVQGKAAAVRARLSPPEKKRLNGAGVRPVRTAGLDQDPKPTREVSVRGSWCHRSPWAMLLERWR